MGKYPFGMLGIYSALEVRLKAVENLALYLPDLSQRWMWRTFGEALESWSSANEAWRGEGVDLAWKSGACVNAFDPSVRHMNIESNNLGTKISSKFQLPDQDAAGKSPQLRAAGWY
jgi:hypothetical protein